MVSPSKKTKTPRQLHERANKLIRKKQAKIKNKQPERDPKYLNWLHNLACVGCFIEEWKTGGIVHLGWAVIGTQACHMGPHGIGQKAGDYTCIPMCAKHHEEIGSSIKKLEALGINYAELTKRLREAYEASK